MRALADDDLRAYRRDQVGLIPSEPRRAMNPVQRVAEYLLEGVRAAGGDVRTARARAVQWLGEGGVADPKRLMRQHPFQVFESELWVATVVEALLREPDLLLVDVPSAEVESGPRAAVAALLDQVRLDSARPGGAQSCGARARSGGAQSGGGVGVLRVFADLEPALAVCDRVVVMCGGRSVEAGNAETLRRAARHPYTRALLGVPPPHDRRIEPEAVVGEPAPSAAEAAGLGCPYVARCPIAIERCVDEMPEPVRYGGGEARCFRVAPEEEGSR